MNDKKIFCYSICIIDDIGCYLKLFLLFDFLSIIYMSGWMKVYKLLFLIMDYNKVFVMKGLIFNSLFLYYGIIGNELVLIFFFVDVCIDLDGNFFVFDFYDDMVYFLDLKGKFLWIFMFVEDGLRGIKCIVMDEFWWL